MIEDRYYIERGWDGDNWSRVRGDGYGTVSEAIIVRDRMRATESEWRGRLDGFVGKVCYRVVRVTREVIE